MMKIGRLRIMKSGRVVLRVEKARGKFVDYEVSKGINSQFHQEIANLHLP